MSYVRHISQDRTQKQKGGFTTNRKEFWLFLSLLPAVLWTDCCCGQSRLSRMKWLEGGPPENLVIVSDEFGRTFLEFDSEDFRDCIIESRDTMR
jgi:hypothetical protein